MLCIYCKLHWWSGDFTTVEMNGKRTLKPVSPKTQATNGHFQNYQKWSRFNGNYQNRRTSMFWFMVLSTKIDPACFQMFRAISGTNADGCRWHDGGADVLLLFFTMRPHLDHANNQKPKYGWYKGSNLEGLKMSDFSIQRRNRFQMSSKYDRYTTITLW